MATWNDVNIAAPELAAAAQARFDAHGLAVMATLRRDGFPRLSGIEPLFADGELWLGMMDNSRKAADVERDPRLSLHNATTDKNVSEGDAKITGRAVRVDADETFHAFRAAFEAHTGYPAPEERFPLFRVNVAEVSTIRAAGDHLVIESWREGEAPKRIERR